jgi:putative cardiolipin synthase
VREVSKEFDLYWNSPSAYPAANFVGPAGPDAVAELEAKFAATHADPGSAAYLEAVRTTPLMSQVLTGQLTFDWSAARLVYDDPAKTLDTTERTDVLLLPELLRTIGRIEKSLDLVSPYFVPGTDGTAALAALADRGVRVRVLTNSLAASDVKTVHAGYAKRRADLLRAGVRLYELKPDAAQKSQKSKTRFGRTSSSGLHAKTFAVDGARIFIGSFNFDQRSLLLNTEMGLLIDNPALARRLGEFFDTEAPEIAYEVRLAPDGVNLEWIEPTSSGEQRYDVDPGTSWSLRMQVDWLSILPIEWLL